MTSSHLKSTSTWFKSTWLYLIAITTSFAKVTEMCRMSIMASFALTNKKPIFGYSLNAYKYIEEIRKEEKIQKIFGVHLRKLKLPDHHNLEI